MNPGGERPVLIVVDVQNGALAEIDPGIPLMGGLADRVARIERVRALVAAWREADAPVVFIQEVHKPSLIDFGRELDGAEDVHALEGDPATDLVIEPEPHEYLIRKRRYSAFFGTELEIVLKAHRADGVVLVGGLTDVCVHYTAVDAHQHDYHVRVVVDCVGNFSLVRL